MATVSDAGKMNFGEVSMKQFKEAIAEHIDAGLFKLPILCLGKAGVGKTEAMIQIAKEKQIGYVELRLVNYTETDIIGIPMPREEGGQLVTKWAQMGKLPLAERDGKRGILVLDEVTSAVQNVRAAALQLLDASRSVGDYKLPEEWLIVALGNGPEDGGVFNGLEPAFLSRCMCFRVEPSLEAWKNWAIPAGIHPAILGFFKMNPDELWNLNLEAEYGGEVYPCPRSWSSLSKVLSSMEKSKLGGSRKALDESKVRIYASACVGVRTGTMFSAFYAFQEHVVDFENIASGKEVPKVKGVAKEVLYLQTQAMIYGIREIMEKGYIKSEGNWTKETYVKVANCVRYMIGIADIVLDIGVTLMRDLVQNYKPFAEMVANNATEFDAVCPEFLKFIDRNAIVW